MCAGRLHASELPDEYLNTDGIRSMEVFLSENKGKKVNVKVIAMTKIKKSAKNKKKIKSSIDTQEIKKKIEKYSECTLRFVFF